jgi:flagellar hook-associated protein 2
VLQGVTLNVQALSTAPVTVNLTLDNTAINKTIADFVTAYNSLHTTTKSLGSYAGKVSGATNGPLLGDSTLRSISTQLRQDTSNSVTSATSSYNSLAMIGISINKDGVMALDSTKLNTALASNLSAVSDVFSSSNGVATRLDSKLTEYLQSGGSLDSQQTSLGKKLTSYGVQRTAVQLRLDNLQKGLQKQFIAMDLAVGQFKATSTYLTQRFG